MSIFGIDLPEYKPLIPWPAFRVNVLILMVYICFILTGIYIRLGVVAPAAETLAEFGVLQSVQNELILTNKKSVFVVLDTQAALLPMVEDRHGRIADILFGNGRGGGGPGGTHDPGRTARETNAIREAEKDRLISKLQRRLELAIQDAGQEARIEDAAVSAGYVKP